MVVCEPVTLGAGCCIYFYGVVGQFLDHFDGYFHRYPGRRSHDLADIFYLSHDTVYFRSQFGKIKLFELANNNPDKDSFHSFVNQIVVHINKSKAAKEMNQSQLLASELKELRRLKDENIVPYDSYEKAKVLIFKHEAFKAAE
jgi:hypothetical protein